MERAFDPYHIWLGIPPEEQPPNHYRLLGVKPFECNADVIQNAADRQMAHLRTFQTGRHSEVSQLLLNEVAAAKICLLNPSRKSAYDARFNAQFARKSEPPALLPRSDEETVAALDFLDEKPEHGIVRIIARPRAKRINGARVATMAGLAAFAVLSLIVFVAWNSSTRQKPRKKSEIPPVATVDKKASRSPGNVGKKEKKVLPSARVAERRPALTRPVPSAPPPAAFVAPPEPPIDSPSATQPEESPIVEKSEPPELSLPEQLRPPPQSMPEQLHAVPDEKEQARAMKRAKGLFAEDFAKAKTGEDKRRTARKILDRAEAIRLDPVEAYVLYRLAYESSRRELDCATAFLAIDAIARRFRVDAVKMKIDVLNELARKARTSCDHQSATERVLCVIDRMILADEFTHVEELCELALAEAVKSRNGFLATLVRSHVQEVQKAARRREAFEAALAALAENPDDPQANSAAGEYLCLFKDDWDAGLPYLAKGSRAEWKTPAERELRSRQKDTDGQVELADEWWNTALKTSEEKRGAIMVHAERLYQRAMNDAEGLAKISMEKRLKQIAAIERPLSSAAPALAGVKPNVKLDAATAELHGPDLNLLKEHGVTTISHWKDSRAWVSWNKVVFRYPGVYEINMLASTNRDISEFVIMIGDKELTGALSQTRGWFNFFSFTAGKINLDQPGEYVVAVRPRRAETWQPFNLAGLTINNVAFDDDLVKRSSKKSRPGRIVAFCDDRFEMYVNGKVVLTSNISQQAPIKDHPFAKGDVITVKCVNTGGPRGFACAIMPRQGGMIVSGEKWRAYFPEDDDTEWYLPENIGDSLPVSPGDSDASKTVRETCGVEVANIWGAEDVCYLFYVVP
ncbi:MAG: hypothetical protein JW959_04400 [Pirellulales bacterium]|nr:hypothetical protein [Pirellulales bacterium]